MGNVDDAAEDQKRRPAPDAVEVRQIKYKRFGR